MRWFAVLFLLLTVNQGYGQESDNLESLTLPPAETKSTKSDLSLPAGNTATSAVVKSSSGDSKKQKDNVGAILDFEGEVIEGERRRPDLFLQISIDNIKFDSLIYNRDDFNDYLEVDRKSRTRFLKMK